MKILAFTGTRADWGLLVPVLKLLRDDSRFELEICATGQHFSYDSKPGALIEDGGFAVDHFVSMGLSEDDGGAALTAAMGTCVAGIGVVIEQAQPDICLLLGDRYEMLCVASAALVCRVPVAHICGGDITRGAFDDSIRHALTKLSSVHFVTSEESARRVRQLGESAANVIVSGSPGIDRIVGQPIIERSEFLSGVGLEEKYPFFLVSFHPETLSQDQTADLEALVSALYAFPKVGLLLTGSNADPGGRAIDRAFEMIAQERGNTAFHKSLGSERYFSAMAHARVLVGNSSSGLYEAPSFRLPTVNIGNRQEGRLAAASVIDCRATPDEIKLAIDRAIALDCADVTNPYGDGRAASRIVEHLSGIKTPRDLLKKTFQDM